MSLKMYTGQYSPKQMNQLNGKIHYKLFCGVRIDPMHPLRDYKLMYDVFSELARGFRIQQQHERQKIVLKPYSECLDWIYTDATCYKSEMRNPNSPKLLWKGMEKVNLSYKKQTRRLLYFLWKMLKEARRI